MVTLAEALRYLYYRARRLWYRVVRRLLRGDRLVWGSERKFRGLLESAPDAIVIVDSHGHIALLNAQAEAMFGHPRGALIGQPVSDLIPRHANGHHRQHLRSFMRDPSARSMGTGAELHALRADGTEIPVEISLSPLQTDEGVLVSAAIRDVTARNRALEELKAAEALFRGAFAGSPIGMAVADQDGRMLRVNAALIQLTGRTSEELIRVPFLTLTHPDHLDRDQRAFAALLSGEVERHSIETRWVHASGHVIWVALQVTMITGDAPAAVRWLLQIEDITHRKHYEDNLQYLATHDALTGLHNRASFVQRLDAHADLVSRYGAEGSVLLLDLDHFKYVNDTLGHQAGDQLVSRVASLLSSRLRDSDVLARIGGDEFAALLPRSDARAAIGVAEDLLAALRTEKIAVPGGRDRTITASCGVAAFDTDATTGEDVLVSADLAMYDAKEAGRNQVAAYSSDDQAGARMRGRITWAERIAVAIEQDGFTLVAQPIVSLATAAESQFEVLLRMRGDDGELIPPGTFLYIAERLGMIGQIDALTVTSAIRALAGADTVSDAVRVEINLSGASVGDPALLTLIERELNETGLDPRRVVFEITETAAIANIAKARRFSEQLTLLGCGFALDDFGAGFGSFYYLKHITFDYLKIDGEFVHGCRENPTDRLIIKAVVDIAKGLGGSTIAEHVGDDETVELLAGLGVDFGQGFHLGMPEPLDGYLARLGGLDLTPRRRPGEREPAPKPTAVWQPLTVPGRPAAGQPSARARRR